MKNNILPGVLAMFLATVFSSCASSIESDAKKVAELSCKAQKMTMKELMSADGNLMQEAAKMKANLAQKYTDPTDRKKFIDAFLKEMKNCR